MLPRFVGRLGLADAVTATNAALGFLAVLAATVDPGVAARLVLLAAVADGLDGLVARRRGGTPAGEYLDSLADVASFCVAPAVLAVAVVRPAWATTDARLGVVVAVAALFVVAGVVRLAMYTANDVDNEHTEGVPTTLSGTLVAAAVLVGVPPAALLAGAAVLTYLMVTEVQYPDLLPRDALVMGVLQCAAIVVPGVLRGFFPKALLAWALAYLLLAPRFYWR